MRRSEIQKKLKTLQRTRLALSVLAVILAAALAATFVLGPKPVEPPVETTSPATTVPATTAPETTVPVTTVPVTTVPVVTVPVTTAPPATVAVTEPSGLTVDTPTVPGTDVIGDPGGLMPAGEDPFAGETTAAATEPAETGEAMVPASSEGIYDSAAVQTAPSTQPAVTEGPAAIVAETEPPVTEVPATEVPATEAPVTEAPATEPAPTEAPAAAAAAAPVTTAATEPAATTAAAAATTVPAVTEAPQEEEPESILPIVQILLAVCLTADLAAIVVLSLQIEKLKKIKVTPKKMDDTFKTVAVPVSKEPAREGEEAEMVNGISIGKVHNIGRRPSQQDSLAVESAGDGLLAVVADGMGGLAGGDKVSQKVVISMITQAASIAPGQMDGVLNQMLVRVNDEVNRMLGPSGQYKSGSTVVSLLIQGGRCHWISVGDSRIYLFRGGSLIQLNHEHTYAQELMQRAMKGEISFEAVQSDPQKDRLTSFIGMGNLRYVDASLHSMALSAGDRLLLMSDGIFNTLPERSLAAILSQYPDVRMAARAMEEQILAAQVPSQDNFTAVILGM